jgi:hypothetical protein
MMDVRASGARSVVDELQGRSLLKFIEQRLYAPALSDALDELGSRCR